MQKCIVNHALTKNAKKGCGTHYPCWEQFCDWLKTEKITISEDEILKFIAWCHHFTHLNSNLTSRAITAAISFLKDNGISLVRKQHTSIKRLLDGYQSLKSPDKRIKLSSSEYHVQKIFMCCVDINKYMSLLPESAMLIGYSLVLRPGEIGYQPRSDEKNLYNESVTWHPNFENPQEISMKIDA